MKNNSKIRFAMLMTVLIVITVLIAKENTGTEFFGQPYPGEEPVLFAPGVISNALYVRDMAITPDGTELYYTVMGNKLSKIIFSKKLNGKWTAPEVAPYSSNADYMDVEPHITPDGNNLYFLSTRPLPGQDYKPGWQYQNIWAMDRQGSTWGEPYPLPAVINNGDGVFFPSVTNDGTLYFSRQKTGTRSTLIYRSKRVNGAYSEPELLPKQVNPTASQFNACIAPDESYIIFCSATIEGKIGLSDYYVCFRKKDDTWSEPIDLGNIVNKPGAQAVSPYISRDGKWFFFASTMSNSVKSPVTMKMLLAMNNEPQNGNSAIYWVSTKIIEKLRPVGF